MVINESSRKSSAIINLNTSFHGKIIGRKFKIPDSPVER